MYMQALGIYTLFFKQYQYLKQQFAGIENRRSNNNADFTLVIQHLI